MQTEYEEKFLTTKQESIKLNIALTRFFETESAQWQERYASYLKKRFRPAIFALITEGNLSKIEILCGYGWYTEKMLPEFIETAQKQNQLEIFLYFLNLKHSHTVSQTTASECKNLPFLCEEILSETRNQLCLEYPFFSHALHSFSFQQTDKPLSTPGTDGLTLYYAPEALIALYKDHPDTLLRIFLHMLYHRMFFHLLLSPKENRRLWHLACDIAVEQIISKKHSRISKPEEIYDLLTEKDLTDERITELEKIYHADEHAYWEKLSASDLIEQIGSAVDTVRRFMEETYGILSNRENFFKKMNVYILQCDCYIQHTAHITCEEDWKQSLDNLQIHGRSGTDFRPVFRYIEELRQKKELRNLKALFYFTDGDGIYPQTPTDYETAFIFYREKSEHQKVPSWATTLILEDKRNEL